MPDSSLHIRDLFVLLAQPAGPALVQPAANTVVSTQNIEFDWSDIFKPRHYQLQIARDAAFSDLVHESAGPASAFVLENAALAAGSDYYWRVRGINHGSITGDWSATGTFRTEGTTSLTPVSAAPPAEYRLLANYPNPFNPVTTIGFRIAAFGFVSLEIFDIAGREVATLVEKSLAAGEYRVQWDAAGQASGMYMVRLQAGDFTSTQKIMLIR